MESQYLRTKRVLGVNLFHLGDGMGLRTRKSRTPQPNESQSLCIALEWLSMGSVPAMRKHTTDGQSCEGSCFISQSAAALFDK